MIDRSRRDAVALVAVMGGVSALAAIAEPVAIVGNADEKTDLDRMFPTEFDDWRVDEVSRAFVRPTVRGGKQYGVYDQVLERTFIDGAGHQIMLSVVYGREQSRPLQLHSPENCYRASGFEVHASQRAMLKLGGRSVTVTNLEAELPGRLEPVTYWTVIGGEPVVDQTSLRWRRLTFAARRQVPDGMLIRLSSINMDPAAAFELHRRFADSMLRAMTPEHRAQVVGSAPDS